MKRKYTLIALAILLIAGIAMIQDADAARSKAQKSTKAKKQYTAKKSPKVVRGPQKLVIHSSFALVEDQKTGECLVQKNPKTVVPIASITKLMTAMVTLDAQMDLKKDIVIDYDDVDTLRNSRSRLPVGTHLSRQEALLLALMASENRAAHALGRTYPGGQDAFVAAMNAKAQSLGLYNTRFTDPTGLSGKNVSSAQDLAAMVDAAYNYPLIRDFSTRDETTIQAGHRKVRFQNTNRLVKSTKWQIGLSKTGFIDEAGRCLVMQAQVAKRPVVIVLLDGHGKMTRFGDANRIKQWMENGSQASSSRVARRG